MKKNDYEKTCAFLKCGPFPVLSNCLNQQGPILWKVRSPGKGLLWRGQKLGKIPPAKIQSSYTAKQKKKVQQTTADKFKLNTLQVKKGNHRKQERRNQSADLRQGQTILCDMLVVPLVFWLSTGLWQASLWSFLDLLFLDRGYLVN